MSQRPLLRVGCLLLAAAGGAPAQDGPFAFRGFGTLGAVRNSTDQAEFIRDISQPKGPKREVDPAVDSRLGLQANLRLSESWEAVVQAVSSRRYDATFTPELTWAFVKWQATDRVVARAGRLGFDVYLLADTRNVGYSYLWVRPPVEYFGGIPITSFDGADLVVHGPIAGGHGSFKAFAGQATGRIPVSGGKPFDLQGSPLLGLHGDLRAGDWGLRLAWAQLRFQREINGEIEGLLAALQDPAVAALSPTAPDLARELAMAGKWVRYLSLGLLRERGPFQAQLGLSRIASQSLTVPTGHAGYLLLGYRIGAWTPFLGGAVTNSSAPARSTGLPAGPPFEALQAGVDLLLRTNQAHQRTLSFGLRWDFHPGLCLKAQVDDIRNREGRTQLWWRANPAWDGRATLASLSLDFTF